MSEFEQLLQENFTSLQRFVKYRVSNRHDADDIIQDVCLTATVKFEALKNRASFKAWLIRIADNKCKDYFRRKAKIMEIPLDALSESVLTTGKFGLTQHNVVRDTIDRLGDREKQILYLYFFKELPQEEIAERLNLPVGTVKSRLHYAKEKFRQHYPYPPKSKGETIMKKLPEILPEYKIEKSDLAPFPVVFEELPNWFIIPKTGEKITWASYDMPERKMTEEVTSEVTCPIHIHGIEGVEISASSRNISSEWAEETPNHIYYAQLTDTHCRWLGELYQSKNGAKHMLTFLDGDDFMAEWGFGEDNCGYETHLTEKGDIRRTDHIITAREKDDLFDIVGRYTIKISDQVFDTICAMGISNDGAATEQYLDQNGRTILWRRFNRNDWANKRYGRLWTALLPENERLTINGVTYVHWYDCVTDYIF